MVTKELRAKWQREYRQRNPERYRIYKQRELIKLSDEVDNLLGLECVVCGFSDSRALCIDHVFNDGAEERRKRMNGRSVGGDRASLYRAVIKNPERFQRLCCNCNRIKAVESGTHIKKYEGIDKTGGLEA